MDILDQDTLLEALANGDTILIQGSVTVKDKEFTFAIKHLTPGSSQEEFAASMAHFMKIYMLSIGKNPVTLRKT